MGADDPRGTSGNLPKRRLRAVFACDVANFSGQISVNETRGLHGLSSVLKVGREELDRHEGCLISTPGDGLFALFESAVGAVNCALAIQERLTHNEAGSMQLRIGIHLGEVLFDGDVPFGETLNIAARLEGLADPGGILVSGAVADATAARVSATFESRGIPRLKNIPRRIGTFSVRAASVPPGASVDVSDSDTLDRTMRFSRHAEPTPVSLDEMNLPAPKRDSARIAQRDVGAHASASGEAMRPEHAGTARDAEIRRGASPTRDPGPDRDGGARSHPTHAPSAPAPAAAPPPVAAPAQPAREAAHVAPRDTHHTAPPSRPAAQTTQTSPTPPAGKAAPAEPPLAASSPPAAAQPFEAEQLAEITQALAVHLGPVARILVARSLPGAGSRAALLATLEANLSYADEVAAFRQRLRHLYLS